MAQGEENALDCTDSLSKARRKCVRPAGGGKQMEVASPLLGTPADADAGTGPSAWAHFLACIGGVLYSLTLPGLCQAGNCRACE